MTLGELDEKTNAGRERMEEQAADLRDIRPAARPRNLRKDQSTLGKADS
ncbi:MAG: hypothetical protein ABEJ78_05395 [Haloferacaceae archaeon]